MKKLMEKEGFRSIAASLLSVLIGLAAGAVIILAVSLADPSISLKTAWEGIRLMLFGVFSTGREAAGQLTFGFNSANLGNMLFRATPLILMASAWPWPTRRACSTSARRASIWRASAQRCLSP